MPDLATPADAPAETPQTQSATSAAVAQNDFLAVDEALRAESRGTPLPPVPVVAKDDAKGADTPERELSKRQQKANEATQAAVTRATADLKAENERLLAQIRAGGAPKQAATPPPAAEPEYKRFLAMPDAPKLDQFDSLEEHSAAMSVFIGQQQRAEWTRQESEKAERQHAVTKAETVVGAYNARIEAAGGEAFVASLSPEVRGLAPVEYYQWEANEARLKGDEAGARASLAKIGPLATLKSCLLQSDVSAQAEKYLSDHPDELERFRALTTVGEVYVAFGKLEARLDSPSSGPSPKVTTATAPPHISGTRSAAPPDARVRAILQNDFAAMEALDRQELLASRRG